MKEFRCGSPECNTHFTAADREELMREVAAHVKKVHKAETATQTLLAYLESTAVTDAARGAKGTPR